MIAGLKLKLDELVWGVGLYRHGLPGRILASVLRNLYAVLRDIISGQLTLRSMSLVYTTLLSIVPLLAFSFSVLKGFGIHEQIQDQMYLFLEPLGDRTCSTRMIAGDHDRMYTGGPAVPDSLQCLGTRGIDQADQAEKLHLMLDFGGTQRFGNSIEPLAGNRKHAITLCRHPLGL